MPSYYVPILAFIGFGIVLSLVALLLGRLISPYRPYKDKLSTYECGFPPLEEARLPFDIRYYRVAILFIIFDIETAFLVPWALSVRQLGTAAFIGIFPFLLVLLSGFIYEWKQGALEWK